MRKKQVLRASGSAILLTLLLLPAIGRAANVTVGCPGGSGTYPSINAALAAIGQIGPSTIVVTGTCHENVSLSNARSLTLIAGTGGAKIVEPQDSDAFDISLSQDITLQNLEIVGTPGSLPGSGGSGVVINPASDVNIIRCDIHDNEGGGVFASRNSVLTLRGTIIHNNNPGDGLDVVNNSTANVAGSTIQDNGIPGVGPVSGQGVFISHSFVAFGQNNLIQNNADHGIGATGESSVSLAGSTTIQGHNINGIYLKQSFLGIGGPALIQGNGTACPQDTALLVSISQACGGISAADNSTVGLRAGTISGNGGAGISARQGTTVGLIGATVSNNSGDGVHIQWISIGNFGSGNNITGNGGKSVFCDERSLVIGDVSAFSKVRCEEIAPPNGPPHEDKGED